MTHQTNYMEILGEYFPDTECYNEGSEYTYGDIVWLTPQISQADLEVICLTDYKTEKIMEFSELAGEDITNGFTSSALGTPHFYDSAPEDQLNLIGAVTANETTYYSCRKATMGLQIVDTGYVVTGATFTGFANNTTTYNAEIQIDGVSEYLSVQGDETQTYQLLVDQLNVDLAGKATVILESGNIKITSDSVGASSTINIIDANMFNQLAQYVSLETPVNGLDASSAPKDYFIHTNAQLLGVLQDGKLVKLDVLQKFNVKKAQILGAADHDAVDLIIWE